MGATRVESRAALAPGAYASWGSSRRAPLALGRGPESQRRPIYASPLPGVVTACHGQACASPVVAPACGPSATFCLVLARALGQGCLWRWGRVTREGVRSPPLAFPPYPVLALDSREADERGGGRGERTKSPPPPCWP
ncbi:hypothetical protein CDD83_4742 [Cordyceps sp. RAO-2017]|nr:hypothetical protein CDD83_4742 [Cordyceps sp. RAO-2017]